MLYIIWIHRYKINKASVFSMTELILQAHSGTGLMKATFHHEIAVKLALWMRSGHALLFLDSTARDQSCSGVFKISLWCYVVLNIQGWLQRLESFHETREPQQHSGLNSPGLDSSPQEKRKLPKHFDHAQADLKTHPSFELQSKPCKCFSFSTSG